jgi:hypothetical protein
MPLLYLLWGADVGRQLGIFEKRLRHFHQVGWYYQDSLGLFDPRRMLIIAKIAHLALDARKQW